jgi:hypothetical protein
VIVKSQITTTGAAGAQPDGYEALFARLRDLALVELDALTAGADGQVAAAIVGTYADDAADALREARTRIAELRKHLVGPDPLNVLEATTRQRASDAAHAGAVRIKDNLLAQAEAGRALARLADLAAALVPKLFDAERRR